MLSYLPRDVSATLLAEAPPAGAGPGWRHGPGMGVIAVGDGDVADPCGGREEGALVAPGRRVVSGQVMTLAVPVITVPVKVGRSGAVRAGGWLPDQVRLGLLETMLGDGVIEELCDRAAAAGLARPGQRRRLMSLPFIMRVVIAMTLLPDSDYAEVLRTVTGLLPLLPWDKKWQVPTLKVVTRWRRRLGPWPLEQLFWRIAGPLAGDGEPGSVMIAGLPLCAVDGSEIAVPATKANLATFSRDPASKSARSERQSRKRQAGQGKAGKNGTEDPFPRLRCLLVTARAGRALLGAAAATTDNGEQALAAGLVRDHPEIFAGRVFLVDRNFPGYHLIQAILDAGGHLIMRVKAGIALPVIPGGWLPDGSRMTYLDEPDHHRAGDRLPLRVAEHNAVLPRADGEEEVSETYTIATTLLDHAAVSAEELREAYAMRWSASETTIGEGKATITGAGPATTPCLRSGEPDLVFQELWAWLAATHLVRAAAASAVTGPAAAPVTARRQGGPAGTDQVSFTTMRRATTASMRQSLVTATTSLPALAALTDRTTRTALHTLVATGRDRHSPRQQKSRPSFPHTAVTKTTVTGPVTINRFQPAAVT